MTPVLKTQYQEQVLPKLKEALGLKNVHQVPYIEKIVINSGFDASIDRGGVEETAREISRIAGQKAVVTKARKSISNFKLREGMPVGVKVTLRGANMYEFMYRLLAVALPGIRDFRGVNDKFDGQGNYTLGVVDHTIFAEASQDHKRTIGMDISFVTTATSDEDGRQLMTLMGMPFRKKNS